MPPPTGKGACKHGKGKGLLAGDTQDHDPILPEVLPRLPSDDLLQDAQPREMDTESSPSLGAQSEPVVSSPCPLHGLSTDQMCIGCLFAEFRLLNHTLNNLITGLVCRIE